MKRHSFTIAPPTPPLVSRRMLGAALTSAALLITLAAIMAPIMLATLHALTAALGAV